MQHTTVTMGTVISGHWHMPPSPARLHCRALGIRNTANSCCGITEWQITSGLRQYLCWGLSVVLQFSHIVQHYAELLSLHGGRVIGLFALQMPLDHLVEFQLFLVSATRKRECRVSIKTPMSHADRGVVIVSCIFHTHLSLSSADNLESFSSRYLGYFSSSSLMLGSKISAESRLCIMPSMKGRKLSASPVCANKKEFHHYSIQSQIASSTYPIQIQGTEHAGNIIFIGGCSQIFGTFLQTL